MSKQKYSNWHKVNKKNEEIVRPLVKTKESNDSKILLNFMRLPTIIVILL